MINKGYLYNMKILITENQLKKLSNSNLLFEYEILPFNETKNEGNRLEYSFNVGDLVYNVTLLGTEDKQLYELGFGVVGQDDVAFRTGKDVEHLNTVIYTVDAIVKEAVTKYRIKKITFSGARGEGDSDVIYVDPIRMKVYFRFLTKKYPNVKFDKDRFGNIVIFMNSIYPEVFSENKDKKEIFLELLAQLNNDNDEDDYWRWDSSFSLDEQGELQGDTDAIVNADYGSIYLELFYDAGYKEYDLSLKFYDTNDEEQNTFKSFNDVVNHLKQRFSLN